MTDLPDLIFKKNALPVSGTVVIFATDSDTLTAHGRQLDDATGGQIGAALRVSDFTGKVREARTVLAPHGTALDRVVIVGLGNDADDIDWVRLGGAVGAYVKKGARISVLVEAVPGGETPAPDHIAALCEGLVLRTYEFDRYKTRSPDGAAAGKKAAAKVTIGCPNAAGARRAYGNRAEVVAGTILARDLVNEPPNALGPLEFAAQAKALSKLGAKVTILTEKQMAARKMNALLAVGRGSVRESRLAVIEWQGTSKSAPPVCFVGKGVVFDTGGISLKPPAGMEDMKGDMGGAAAVIGLMRALVGRKAKVNAIGILGLVENMPDGDALRPGDIVTSMSGQTIEIINTDAEGRLVLCDALWYAQEIHKAKTVINLATLTGAIVVALGSENAGMFCNDDALAGGIVEASKATREGVWRMPLSATYDKLIDSKFADMKNTGGRQAGSVTAAQFLKRHIKEGVAWAHLDIAGTAMGVPKTEISRGWASGFGVRLLDRLVSDRFER